MADDRLERLLAQDRVTGIDFVYVHAGQTTIDVFFHVDPATLATPFVDPVDPASVRIVSTSERATVPRVEVLSAFFTLVDGRRALRLVTSTPGDFSLYTLTLEGAAVDRRYNGVVFSFKANCPSDLDCKAPAPECPPEVPVDYPVDYSARDFWSYRGALLDFASHRYPEWKDRLEADVGVMFAEVLAAVGDEMAYFQDRIARQPYLETATERKSVRRLARLVDYELDDGQAAATWLDVTVESGAIVLLPAGTPVFAASDAGERTYFELGHGLSDALSIPPRTFQVRDTWNALAPHLWDEDETCLPYGATELWVVGHHRTSLFPVGLPSERLLLLKTAPTDPGKPARTHLVKVRAEDVEEDRDHVFEVDVTRLRWDAAYATPFELDLEALEVRANLVPATAGLLRTARFCIGESFATEAMPASIEREGPGGVTIHRVALEGSGSEGLAFLPTADSTDVRSLRPEVRLFELEDAGGGALVRGTEWTWRRSLLGVASSDPEDRHFTLEDGTWGPLLTWDRPEGRIVHRDYRSSEGFTLRFGDGEFGRIPPAGTRFEIVYRLGNGKRGNVAAETLSHLELALPIERIDNPLPAEGGRDPEPLDEVRKLAPEAFRAVTFRAVRAEDYAEAVERLPEVQRAGAGLRWTGSWLTLFATPDPIGTARLSPALRETVQDQLDRFRQAGREAHVRAPLYAFLDLEITICIEPWAYRGQVEEQVRVALFGKRPFGPKGFFDPDRFTFGTPLERSQLEATLHAVAGVRAVKSMKIRRRGFFPLRDFVEPYYQPGANEVVGLENDPLYPERGSLRLVTEGGA